MERTRGAAGRPPLTEQLSEMPLFFPIKRQKHTDFSSKQMWGVRGPGLEQLVRRVYFLCPGCFSRRRGQFVTGVSFCLLK